MRIVVPHDVSGDEIREALSPFAPVENIALTREGNTPAAII